MKRLLLVLMSAILFAGCITTKNQQSSKEVQKAIATADIIVKRIDSIINLPIVPKAVQITPTTMDDAALYKIRQGLLVVLPYLSNLKGCYSEDLNEMLLCLATNLRNVPEDKRKLLEQQIKIIIAVSQS